MNEVLSILEPVGFANEVGIPRIAVIGNQSSGKSSVLESIAGISFLPKGDSLVTRCPIVVQYMHKNTLKPYVEFEQFPGKKFEDFEAVRKQIEILTDEFAGESKNIVDAEIRLNVYSKDVRDLTLVDLPGIIHTTTDEQREELIDEVIDLISNYISSENTVILLLHEAHVDMSTEKSFALRKKFDPEGKRTLGVITKTDRIEHPDQIIPFLNGTREPLKYSYFAVRNRTTQDLEDKITVEQSRDKEMQELRRIPGLAAYRDHLGFENLTKTLSEILTNNIKSNLPKIVSAIRQNLHNCTLELSRLPPNLLDDPQVDPFKTVGGIISDYCKKFEDLHNGSAIKD